MFYPGLDIFIGLPFSENYRVAKSEGPFLTTVEDFYGFFFENGWKLLKPGRFQELLGDIMEPRVSLQMCKIIPLYTTVPPQISGDIFCTSTVVDPGFPVGGRRPIGGRQPLTCTLFGENVCENKRNGSCWGGTCAGGAPLDPPMLKIKQIKNILIISTKTKSKVNC